MSNVLMSRTKTDQNECEDESKLNDITLLKSIITIIGNRVVEVMHLRCLGCSSFFLLLGYFDYAFHLQIKASYWLPLSVSSLVLDNRCGNMLNE